MIPSLRPSLALLTVLTLAACDSQGPIQARQPLRLSPVLDSLTRVDAEVLALRVTLASKTDPDHVDIDPVLMESLYQAVGRVRSSEHAGLVEGISAFQNSVYRHVFIAVAPFTSWTQPWAEGKQASGNPEIDDLIREFGLQQVSYIPTSQWTLVRFSFDRPLNASALGRRFRVISGVIYAGSEGVGGDGDDIEPVRETQAWHLDFKRGSGDCRSGCLDRSYWTFRVSDSGRVDFLGTHE